MCKRGKQRGREGEREGGRERRKEGGREGGRGRQKNIPNSYKVIPHPTRSYTTIHMHLSLSHRGTSHYHLFIWTEHTVSSGDKYPSFVTAVHSH